MFPKNDTNREIRSRRLPSHGRRGARAHSQSCRFATTRNADGLKPIGRRAYLSEGARWLSVRNDVAWNGKRKGSRPLSTLALSRAGARRAPHKVSPVRPDADETLRIVLARIDAMKAEDTIAIDLAGKTEIADTMVVTSARSNRQVGAIADHIRKDLAAAGIKGVRVEGMPQCDWVLIDAGDVIVHVFRPEVRTFYNLEKMWAGAGPTRLDELAV